jgi:hypothetical protein|tara:strand:+ start:898 stop:1140 length:243 start_codon:yes stop_codon:yes gene_type:complete
MAKQYYNLQILPSEWQSQVIRLCKEAYNADQDNLRLTTTIQKAKGEDAKYGHSWFEVEYDGYHVATLGVDSNGIVTCWAD